MSKERARRRAEREALAAAQREARRRRARRRARWHAVTGVTLWRRLRHRRPRRPVDAVLRRRKQRQDGVLLAVLVALHAALWLWQPSWWWRGSALVLTVVCWPVLVVVLFDRRASR